MRVPTRGQASKKKLRFGIVGLGKMGLLHWQTWRRFSNVEVNAVVDTDPAVAAWAEEQGVAFFRNPTDLLGLVDAAVIATPAGEHLSCALPLLVAGVHCLVEKPIALEVGDGESLVAAAARHGALLAIGHSERFNPGVRRVRDETASAPKRIEVFRMAPLRQFGHADADVVQDLMIHDLDWVMDLMGQTPTGVSVTDARRLNSRLSYVNCELNFAQGVQVTLIASRIETVGRREVLVHGVDGRTRAFNLSIDPNSPETDPLTLQARAFVEALQGKATAIATGKQAVQVTELGERIRAQCEEVDALSL